MSVREVIIEGMIKLRTRALFTDCTSATVQFTENMAVTHDQASVVSGNVFACILKTIAVNSDDFVFRHYNNQLKLVLIPQ